MYAAIDIYIIIHDVLVPELRTILNEQDVNLKNIKQL